MLKTMECSKRVKLQSVFTQTRTESVQHGKFRVTYGIDNVDITCIRELLADLHDFQKPDAVVQLEEFPDVLPLPKPQEFLQPGER